MSETSGKPKRGGRRRKPGVLGGSKIGNQEEIKQRERETRGAPRQRPPQQAQVSVRGWRPRCTSGSDVRLGSGPSTHAPLHKTDKTLTGHEMSAVVVRRLAHGRQLGLDELDKRLLLILVGDREGPLQHIVCTPKASNKSPRRRGLAKNVSTHWQIGPSSSPPRGSTRLAAASGSPRRAPAGCSRRR